MSYGYDALGRLTQSSASGGPNSGRTTSLSYDAAGNRTNYTSNGPTAAATLSVAGASANEGSPLTFTVTRSGVTYSAASASWSTTNGSAIAGTNYTSSSGTVSFVANQTSATFAVPTIDDHVATGALTMTVNLSSPSSGAAIGTGSATGTINNIDAAPATLSIASASANEGSSLSFTVTRSGTTTSAVSATWSTSNGSASAGTNYTSSSGTVSFAAGQTTATVTVPTIDDHVATGALTMTVNLSSPSSGAAIGTGSATGTINNIDATPSISIAAASANEGSPLTFSVSRAGATGTAVSASWATANGSAVAGTNYTASSGTVSFAVGQTTSTVTVPTIDDHVITGSLGMTVNLPSPAGGATIGTPSATGTINNIDTAWTSTITAASVAPCGIYCPPITGYSQGLAGSMSNTSFGAYTITGVFTQSGVVKFILYGSATAPNSGWTSISVPGVGMLLRSAATYDGSLANSATWSWSGQPIVGSGTVTIQ